MLRRILASALFALALPLAAQQPPKLEPLPEPPPPPPGASAFQPGEPSARIEPGASEQIDEKVIDGRRVVRVTTPSWEDCSLYYHLVYSACRWHVILDGGLRRSLS